MNEAKIEEKYTTLHFRIVSEHFVMLGTEHIRSSLTGAQIMLYFPGSTKFESMKMLLSDWIFLAVLGVLVAFISISVDMMIYYFQEGLFNIPCCLK